MGDSVNSPQVGQRVRIPWGRKEVEGTIVAVFGPTQRRYVRIALELSDSDEPDPAPVVALPADAIEASATV